MEEIKNMLLNMQQDLKQQKTDMLEMKEDIKSTINNNINEKFNSLELKNELLEKKVNEQNIKINNLERHIRRKNLVFFGVEEREKSYHELEEIIINFINTHFEISCTNSNIEVVRRLGKKGEKIRPVVITFTTMGYKLIILRNKHKLHKTSYYIKEDYPVEVLSKRKELQVQVLKEKEAGNTAFIKYDKLIILNNNKHISRNQINKRNLSESPETSHPNSQMAKHDNKQPSKKNKATNMKDYILQKPKLNFTNSDTSQKQAKTTQSSAL